MRQVHDLLEDLQRKLVIAQFHVNEAHVAERAGPARIIPMRLRDVQATLVPVDTVRVAAQRHGADAHVVRHPRLERAVLREVRRFLRLSQYGQRLVVLRAEIERGAQQRQGERLRAHVTDVQGQSMSFTQKCLGLHGVRHDHRIGHSQKLTEPRVGRLKVRGSSSRGHTPTIKLLVLRPSLCPQPQRFWQLIDLCRNW